MAWTVELSTRAQKALSKLDRQISNRIIAMLEDVEQLDDPRLRGHGLTGPLKHLWSYRAGDWRVLARIEDARVLIVVVEIENRSKIYRSS